MKVKLLDSPFRATFDFQSSHALEMDLCSYSQHNCDLKQNVHKNKQTKKTIYTGIRLWLNMVLHVIFRSANEQFLPIIYLTKSLQLLKKKMFRLKMHALFRIVQHFEIQYYGQLQLTFNAQLSTRLHHANYILYFFLFRSANEQFLLITYWTQILQFLKVVYFQIKCLIQSCSWQKATFLDSAPRTAPIAFQLPTRFLHANHIIKLLNMVLCLNLSAISIQKTSVVFCFDCAVFQLKQELQIWTLRRFCTNKRFVIIFFMLTILNDKSLHFIYRFV